MGMGMGMGMGDDIELGVNNAQQSTAAHNQSESHSCDKDDTQTDKE